MLICVIQEKFFYMESKISPFETIFDTEVIELIQALDLVQMGTPEWRSWFAVLVESHYTKYWF